jgi:hypothetical protein
MKKKRQLLFWILFFYLIPLFAQQEELNYTVYYHWGPVWVKGGTLKLSTKFNNTPQGDTLVLLEGIGLSSPEWRWFFRVEDYYTSWCFKKDGKPLKASKNTQEGSLKKENHYTFDYEKKRILVKSQINDKPGEYDTLKMDTTYFDAQCATYYLRNLPLEKFSDKDSVSLNLILDGELIKQTFLIYKDQRLEDDKGRLYHVLKYTAVIEENDFFKGGEPIQVWVTDDIKRTPLKIKADLIVGSIEVFYKGKRFHTSK